MSLVPEIQITNLLALTSELFGKSKIINLPEKAVMKVKLEQKWTKFYFLQILFSRPYPLEHPFCHRL